jgi:hypothetical protein
MESRRPSDVISKSFKPDYLGIPGQSLLKICQKGIALLSHSLIFLFRQGKNEEKDLLGTSDLYLTPKSLLRLNKQADVDFLLQSGLFTSIRFEDPR